MIKWSHRPVARPPWQLPGAVELGKRLIERTWITMDHYSGFFNLNTLSVFFAETILPFALGAGFTLGTESLRYGLTSLVATNVLTCSQFEQSHPLHDYIWGPRYNHSSPCLCRHAIGTQGHIAYRRKSMTCQVLLTIYIHHGSPNPSSPTPVFKLLSQDHPCQMWHNQRFQPYMEWSSTCTTCGPINLVIDHPNSFLNYAFNLQEYLPTKQNHRFRADKQKLVYVLACRSGKWNAGPKYQKHLQYPAVLQYHKEIEWIWVGLR